MAAITINHLSYSYVNHGKSYLALDDLDFQIRSGEFVCLIGHSGCGKTTLLKALAGLILPDKGQIYIGDKQMKGPGTDRAVVFQDYSLFPWMTARQNVMFGIQQAKKNLPKKQAEPVAEEFLLKVGLKEFKNHFPAQLSGGMKQRVAIARSLAMDPDILLLDEPFGALDAKRRKELQQLLEELWGSGAERKTVLFVTHDIDEAILLADRIIFMGHGKNLACLKVPYARPRDHEEILGLKSCEKLKADLLQLFYLDQELIDEEKS